MIKPENINFPITGERIAALQQAELGRELTSTEREIFADIATIANEAYEAATRGDAETVAAILAAINTAPAPDNYTSHVAALCRGWVLLGCRRGAEQLKTAIDGLS